MKFCHFSNFCRKIFSAWRNIFLHVLNESRGFSTWFLQITTLKGIQKCAGIVLSSLETFFCRNSKNDRISFWGQCNVETALRLGIYMFYSYIFSVIYPWNKFEEKAKCENVQEQRLTANQVPTLETSRTFRTLRTSQTSQNFWTSLNSYRVLTFIRYNCSRLRIEVASNLFVSFCTQNVWILNLNFASVEKNRLTAYFLN